MFRSSLRAIVLSLPTFLPTHQLATGQTEPVIPWLQGEGAAQGDIITPSPEPTLQDRKAGAEAQGGAVEEVASELAAAIIGVDRLPTLGRRASADIWVGSDEEAIAEAIKQVEISDFRSVNLLLRELLSTPVESSATPLASERASALLRIGALPDALAVAHSATNPSPPIVEIVTKAALLFGHGASACTHARLDGNNTSLPGAVGIFCEALLGSPAVASVRLELERELGSINPSEAVLLDAVIDPELLEFVAHPDSATGLSDFEAGLMGHLGLPLPEGYAEEAPERQIWRLVEESSEVVPDRLAAMARLEAAGLIDTPSFRNAILGSEPDPEDETGIWTALLLQMANTRDPALFGKLIEASLKLGRRQGREALAARLVSLPARRRVPDTQQSMQPSVMRRLFLLAGDPDTALLWLSLHPAPEDIMLFAIALPEFDGTWDAEEEADLAVRFNQENDLRAGQVLAALEAFGLSRRTPAGNALPRTDTFGPQTDELRAGERALLAVADLRQGPIAPDALRLAAQTLDRAGLGDQARQIVIEVILLDS